MARSVQPRLTLHIFNIFVPICNRFWAIHEEAPVKIGSEKFASGPDLDRGRLSAIEIESSTGRRRSSKTTVESAGPTALRRRGRLSK